MARLGRAQPFPPKVAGPVVTAATATNASAEVATATATANNASLSVKTTGGLASVTATANNATVISGLIVNPGAGSVTATANNASVSVKPTAGRGTATATANNATVPAGTLFATSVSANGRYLLDQDGNPYFINGNSPQLLISKLTLVEVEAFFADQQARGINSSQVHLMTNELIQGNSGSVNANGDPPFSNMTALTGANTNYWTFVDGVFDLAETYGVTLWAAPIENISYASTINSMSDAQCIAFGEFIGQRYASRPNVVWVFGNDFQPEQWFGRESKNRKVIEGIKNYDTAHLITLWLDYTDSISQDIDTQGGYTSWNGLVDISLAYSYTLPYYQIEKGYASTTWGTTPIHWGEGNYEGEHNHPEFGQGSTTDETIRRSNWWSVTWGACGSFFGQAGVWNCTDQDNPSLLGSNAAVQNALVAELITSFDNWQDLVPDTGHALLTAGYGTHSTAENLDPLDNNYATMAKTPDGSLAIGYFPDSRAITLDTSVMSSPVTGYWYDPTNGATVTDNPPVVHPGANAAGQHDWVLVLEGPSATNASAERATTTATANNAAASVKPSAGSSSATATGQTPAASVKASAGFASATASAFNATVQTGAFTNASAGLASVTATANDAAVSVKASASVATVTAAANLAAAGLSPAAGSASVTATAQSVKATVAPTSSVATVTVTAIQPAADNGAGVATYFKLVRLARPQVVRMAWTSVIDL